MATKITPEKPGEGQESVWDYPRPPRVEKSNKRVRVILNGIMIADSTNTLRVLETSHPPVYYIPPEDIVEEYFNRTSHRTFCEFKGQAAYYTISVNGVIRANAAWFYPNPVNEYEILKNHLAIYPSKMDACFLDDEQVSSQEGDFYGGWITSDIVGPFKGGAGTLGW